MLSGAISVKKMATDDADFGGIVFNRLNTSEKHMHADYVVNNVLAVSTWYHAEAKYLQDYIAWLRMETGKQIELDFSE